LIENCNLWLSGKLVIVDGIEDNNSIYTSDYTEVVAEEELMAAKNEKPIPLIE